MNKQSGFTLIELVMVIVILGILAATAIPRFVDLSAEAEQASTEGVAGSLSAAGAINYASCSAGNADCSTFADGDDCDAVATALVLGDLTDFTLTGGPIAGEVSGDTLTCTVTSGGGTATATVVLFTSN